MIVLVRCDDRLIHGQCMTVIIQEYDIKRIIVVDDFTATNAILKTVFRTAAPPSIETDVFTVEESAERIKAAQADNVRTLVLMKSPLVYEGIAKLVSGLPGDFNIGPMSNRKGTSMITDFINCLPEEIEAIRRIADSGVHVYFRQTPARKKVEWDDIKNNY